MSAAEQQRIRQYMAILRAQINGVTLNEKRDIIEQRIKNIDEIDEQASQEVINTTLGTSGIPRSRFSELKELIQNLLIETPVNVRIDRDREREEQQKKASASFASMIINPNTNGGRRSNRKRSNKRKSNRKRSNKRL